MALSSAQFHRISKALADPTRYKILSHIAADDELACNDLRGCTTVSAATLSHHLKELSDAGLIDVRRSAKFMYLKVRRSVWKQYLQKLARL